MPSIITGATPLAQLAKSTALLTIASTGKPTHGRWVRVKRIKNTGASQAAMGSDGWIGLKNNRIAPMASQS